MFKLDNETMLYYKESENEITLQSSCHQFSGEGYPRLFDAPSSSTHFDLPYHKRQTFHLGIPTLALGTCWKLEMQ